MEFPLEKQDERLTIETKKMQKSIVCNFWYVKKVDQKKMWSLLLLLLLFAATLPKKTHQVKWNETLTTTTLTNKEELRYHQKYNSKNKKVSSEEKIDGGKTKETDRR